MVRQVDVARCYIRPVLREPRRVGATAGLSFSASARVVSGVMRPAASTASNTASGLLLSM
jgi:hypothetical protein